MEDFEFLDEKQRTDLQQSVELFLAVAEQVRRKKTATQQQADEGRVTFSRVLSLLQFDKFNDAESFQTQIQLKRKLQGKLPGWVTGISCDIGLDLYDDPAIWIWIEITDDATDKRLFVKYGQRIEDKVRLAYHEIGGRLWPFVRFRNPSEMVGRQGAAS